ncbi:PREDICTED: tyramine/octopamine receptor-like [Priapulus caudatus]|uniref:Tyramine/octopamine receptor-like n=1 Tax=Priapulus caudatus TaxID=37621 RepID=A0ABM1E1A1_PRICU|nr:PREDICTED: tyramine/octopamine receptor-like [Priapulus caudatus]
MVLRPLVVNASGSPAIAAAAAATAAAATVSNGSNSQLPPHENATGEPAVSIPASVFVAIFLSLIIVMTIAGNVLVVLSVFTYKPLRQVQNFFIVSLAVADMLVAALVMPFNVVYSIAGYWVFGDVFCYMWLTCDVLCCTASILNLCAIALDRYYAIHDPLNYAQKRTKRRVLTIIFFVWFISSLISVPPLIGWNDWSEEAQVSVLEECKLTEERGYIIYSSSGSFYIPLIIMATVYVKIFLATRRRLREKRKVAKQVYSNTPMSRPIKSEVDPSSSDPPSETLGGETAADTNASDLTMRFPAEFCATPGEKLPLQALQEPLKPPTPLTPPPPTSKPTTRKAASGRNGAHAAKNGDRQTNAKKPAKSHFYGFLEEKQKISLSKERRAAKTLGIIMGVFVLCWLPFFLMYVILPFCAGCQPQVAVINFITWLGYVNSALNPVIYTIFNIDFRRAFQKLLSVKC